MDRFKFQPWGLDGGRAGAPGDCWLDPDSDQPNHVGKIDIMRLNPGTVFSVRTPGGGGLGDPLERTMERVADDVRNGRVSVEGAARDYGVVVGRDGVDSLRRNTGATS